MILSKQKLLQEAKNTGFRAEILEKVLLLMQLLSEFEFYPQIQNKLALKGGTALNLFYFDLPRLSVDIDLNYIGSAYRGIMLKEQEVIQKTMISICQKQGFYLDRNPKVHAGGKMIWRYPSVITQTGNLEIDLNYMFRTPLWPIEFKSSCTVASTQIHNIPVLNLHELSAGKLCALIDRHTGRDLFDTYHLLTQTTLDDKKLRLALVVYAGISRKNDLRKINADHIIFNLDELRNRLIPLLSQHTLNKIDSVKLWAEQLAIACRQAFHRFLPLVENEIEFLTRLLDFGEINASLLCNDVVQIENINNHPALKWSAENTKKQIKDW